MNDKERYIEQELDRAVASFMPVLLLISAVGILLLGILDFLVVPEHVLRFFLYRAVTAALWFCLFVFYKITKRFEYSIIIIATVAVSLMVEAMVLTYGGHESTYYAGFIIIFVFLLGFLPITFRFTLLLAALIYTVYLVPVLVLDTISNPRLFIGNNVFLFATLSGGLFWKFLNFRQHRLMLGLEFDLAREKKQLETYTLQLESMVAERTKELSKSNKRHEALFENATDGILVMDKNGVIIDANAKACEMHGFEREALIGIHSSLLEVEENRLSAGDRLQRMLKGESLTYETAHFMRDGTRISLEISGRAISIADETFIQAFQRDITEKKTIQEHLFQSQKMESIGALAGGIAHDFNNILTVIIGYVSTIRKDAGGNEKILNKLTVVENAARKASSLTAQLLGFARKKELEMLPLQLNDLIRDSLKLLEKMIDQKITIDVRLREELPLIRGDFTKLEQVIMNFTVNARDAMPYGGTITISTDVVEAYAGAPDIPPYLPAGAYAVIRIADTGVGIPEEIQRKIFEPFFTTKERGKGTGLGLAMVYGTVTEHKGYVTCQSKVGEGTVFTVYLPVPPKTAEVVKQGQEAVARKFDTILVVDDDEDALAAIKDTLDVSGHRVIATTSPMSALDTFKKMHKEIDLVITDMVLPLIDGRELMKQMAAIHPMMRFIAVSGFSQLVRRHDDVKPDFFIQKPFETYHLLSAVQKIITEKKYLPKPGESPEQS
jgi:two-component system, cell cycle sensor histidine kinase and response regulator CckA